MRPTTTPEYFTQLCNSLASKIILRLTDETPLESIVEAVKGLPKDWLFGFYDRHHPSNSDPGAWIEAERVGKRYRLRHWNHGWVGKWAFHSPEEIAEYAYRCRTHKHPFYPEESEANLRRKP